MIPRDYHFFYEGIPVENEPSNVTCLTVVVDSSLPAYAGLIS